MTRLAPSVLFALISSIALGACAPTKVSESAEETSVAPDQATVRPQAAIAGPDGSFRSGAPIRLPVPVSQEPVRAPVSDASLALRGETVEQAIVTEMGEAAIGIDVKVDKGFVMLSGDVATEADFQRANYVARAQPGVIEVDQSEMRVIR